MSPRVLSIVVNYNGGHWVEEAVASLCGQTHANDILVVDNSSTDGSGVRLAERFARDPRVEVLLTGENPGPAAAYNRALEYEGYDYYFYLNPDANAGPDVLERLLAVAEKDLKLAIVGPIIVEHDRPDIVQESAPRLDRILFTYDPYEQAPVASLPTGLLSASYACAASMLVRAQPFREVEGNDADFFMFADESDLMWRMRLLGYECAIATDVRVRHVGGASAPVGREGGVYRTSLRRIYLREINCWRMGIKCLGTPRLIQYILLNFAWTVAEGLAMRLLGRREMARVYVNVIRDLWRERKSLLAKRRRVQVSRRVSDAIALRTFYPGFAKVVALRRRGLPSIVAFRKS